jgi:hypothetical protein
MRRDVDVLSAEDGSIVAVGAFLLKIATAGVHGRRGEAEPEAKLGHTSFMESRFEFVPLVHKFSSALPGP